MRPLLSQPNPHQSCAEDLRICLSVSWRLRWPPSWGDNTMLMFTVASHKKIAGSNTDICSTRTARWRRPSRRTQGYHGKFPRKVTLLRTYIRERYPLSPTNAIYYPQRSSSRSSTRCQTSATKVFGTEVCERHPSSTITVARPRPRLRDLKANAHAQIVSMVYGSQAITVKKNRYQHLNSV